MIIDGKKIAAQIKNEVKAEISENFKSYNPTLAVIQVGDNTASNTYVRNKEKACEYVGIKPVIYKLPKNTNEKDLLNLIDDLTFDVDINGVIVQLPLPKHICEKRVINRICVHKDVDGFHPLNVGKLVIGDYRTSPCTPAGIIEMLKRSNIEIAGKHCVVVGRSNIVGKPVAQLLLNENATVTIAHSKTRNLKEITKRADILVVAVGRAKFITEDYVKDGTVVIDVGINWDENGKLCGDVDFDNVAGKCKAITPVPGGVGQVTVAMLMKNCLEAAKEQSVREHIRRYNDPTVKL